MSPAILFTLMQAVGALIEEWPQIKEELLAIKNLLENNQAPTDEQLQAVQSIIDRQNQEIQDA